MLVKVCGLRDAANIRAVEALGADWAGFVFYPRSPRYVSAPPAYLPRRCRRVGVFVNAQPDDVADHVRRYGLGAVQLHGDEPPRYCHRLRRLLPPGCLLLKAVGIGSAADVDRATAYGPDACDYLLFDTACAGRGGCGRTFDWGLLARYPDDADLLTEMVELIVDTVCAKRKSIRVCGSDYPHEVVKSRLLKLDAEHLQFALHCLHENTTKIKNIKQYLLATLYNAPLTIGSYVQAQVSHDLNSKIAKQTASYPVTPGERNLP